MKKMIIYIHGFASSGYGSKALIFKAHFKAHAQRVRYLHPSLSPVPQLAVATLENLIETLEKDYEIALMGSSLGGFYALYLAERYGLKAVLINPALKAQHTLLKYAGLNKNFYDGAAFEMLPSHLEYLKTLEQPAPADQEKLLLMLQKGDDVLDYREALALLPKAKLILEEGGDHSFSGIERHFDAIEDFLA